MVSITQMLCTAVDEFSQKSKAVQVRVRQILPGVQWVTTLYFLIWASPQASTGSGTRSSCTSAQFPSTMFGGMFVITGGVVSTTRILFVKVAVLPQRSVAFHSRMML